MVDSNGKDKGASGQDCVQNKHTTKAAKKPQDCRGHPNSHRITTEASIGAADS